MNEQVVAKWIPIIPQKEARPSDEKVTAQVDGFIETLFEQGYYELASVDGLQPLVLTLREYHDPELKRLTEKPVRSRISSILRGNKKIAPAPLPVGVHPPTIHRSYRNGFTDLYVLDLLEQDQKDKKKYHPVGYRDYRVLPTSDTTSRASGQNSALRKFLPKCKQKKFREALERADHTVTTNGIEIADHLRNKKIGALLMAVALEVLHRNGITELDFAHSGISNSFMPLAEKLGYSHDNKMLRIEDLITTDLKRIILPFIKQ